MAATDLLNLADPGARDPARVGGKAARLAALTQAGFPIPAGFCIPVDALPDPTRWREGDPVLTDEVRGRLRDCWETLNAPHGCAVRSSATTEDAATGSAAGQYLSVLNIRTVPALVDAVEGVWRSLSTDQAVTYRRHHPSSRPPAMAVLIQVMAAPRWAGVLFTSDTLHPDDDSVTVIEAVPGLADALVEGTLNPTCVLVDRQAPHHLLHEERSDTGTAAPLTDAAVTTLARLGLKVEELFGGPQDIEWVLGADGPLLVQARPITADLPRGPRWSSPVPGARWARMSICDSWLSQPLSPLFATAIFPRLVEVWTTNWGGPAHRRARNPVIPHPMHGTVNGFAYLRFDFPLTKHPVRTVALIGRWLAFHLSPVEQRWRRQVLPALQAEVATFPTALSGMGSAELLAAVDRIVDRSADYWAIIGGLAWHWNASEWALGWCLRRVARSPVSVAALLVDDSRSVQRGEAALDAIAAADPGARAEMVAAYLADFGHLVYSLDVAEPTSAEDPVAAVAAVAARGPGWTSRPATQQRRSAEGAVVERLPPLPGLRRGWRGLLRWAQHWAQIRDQAIHSFTLGWPALRRGYLELGARLQAAGVIVAADDVFYLTREELAAAVADAEGCGHGSDLTEAVEERRRQRLNRQRWVPPDVVPEHARVHFLGMDLTQLALFGVTKKADEGAASLRGSAVSPGRHAGRARVVSDLGEAAQLEEGEVLVVAHLTPAWAPLLARAGAVVADAGGALSHGSVVAREYGIPAVLGTKRAMSSIVTGQTVIVDGDVGLVSWDEPPGPADRG